MLFRSTGRPKLTYALFAAWMALLLLPSATIFSTAHSWDADPRLLLAITAAYLALLWLIAGSGWFFLVTLPLAFFGLVAISADLLRNANLLEIALLSGHIDPHEAYDAFAPYFMPMGIALAVLIACVVAAFRAPLPMPAARIRLGVAGVLAGMLGLAALIEPATLLRAWPMNVASLQVARAIGRPDFIATALPWAPVNPRAKNATWSATRTEAAPERETYIIVVGESVRADQLAACGGNAALRLPPEAIVYCDVTSGSSSTHTSVPLLLSREMPGGTLRVSTDATVLRAFAEAGFKSYWLGVQGPTIAWPDADVERYARTQSTTRRDLMPMLREALSDPAPRKVIVLHTYDAHFNYCDRYDAETAPLPVDCKTLGNVPTRATREPWLAAYGNAIAEMISFLGAVTRELELGGGESFLVYTSDHGENLFDDERGLFNHSLKDLTRYDTRVPMIFWASSSWRGQRTRKASALARHRSVRAMHADLVPTVLGAAGIQYRDSRPDVADLTREDPPHPRIRWASPRLGEAVDADQLR